MSLRAGRRAGDAVLAVRYRSPGMVLGAAVAAVLHLGSAWWLR